MPLIVPVMQAWAHSELRKAVSLVNDGDGDGRDRVMKAMATLFYMADAQKPTMQDAVHQQNTPHPQPPAIKARSALAVHREPRQRSTCQMQQYHHGHPTIPEPCTWGYRPSLAQTRE